MTRNELAKKGFLISDFNLESDENLRPRSSARRKRSILEDETEALSNIPASV